MDDNQTLCAKLRERERQLHCRETRNQLNVIDELLHEQFLRLVAQEDVTTDRRLLTR